MKSSQVILGLILFAKAQLLFAQSSYLVQTPQATPVPGWGTDAQATPSMISGVIQAAASASGSVVPMPVGTALGQSPSDPANQALPTPGAEPTPLPAGPVSDFPAARPHPDACCWWVQAEYLLWWVKDAHVSNALVSTGAANDVNTQVLFGGSDVDFGAFSGGRLAVGTWLDDFHIFGLESRGFVLVQRTATSTFGADGAGNTALGLPFFNSDAGQQGFVAVSTPGETAGRIDVSLSSQMWGAESNLTVNIHQDAGGSFDLLGGYRYLGLREVMQIGTTTAPLAGQAVFFDKSTFGPPALTSTVDRFSANTDFQGAQLGAHAQWRFGSFALDVTGKVAIGESFATVNVTGASTLQGGPALPTRTLPGGIFAVPSNLGHVGDDEVAVVPAVEAKLSWQLGRHLNVFASYDCLYWSRVVRASQQVNSNVSAVEAPTSPEFGLAPMHPLQPQPSLTSGDFWAQGFGVGIEFQF